MEVVAQMGKTMDKVEIIIFVILLKNCYVLSLVLSLKDPKISL